MKKHSLFCITSLMQFEAFLTTELDGWPKEHMNTFYYLTGLLSNGHEVGPVLGFDDFPWRQGSF